MNGTWRGGGLVMGIFLGMGWGVDAAPLSRRAKEEFSQRAEVLFKAGRFEEARDQWIAALAGGPTRAEVRRWRPKVGRTYEAEGNYEKALTAFQEAYDADPKNVDRLVDLARLYDAVEIDDQALRHYTLAHRRDRSRRDVTFALAKLHWELGHLGEARKLAEVAVKAEPRDYSAQELLANIEESQGLLADAGRRWETVVSLNPSAERYMILGRLWARQDAYEQAAIAFSQAEQMGDTGPAPTFERAVLAERKGDRKGATQLLEKATRQGPEYFPPDFWMVLMALEEGNTVSARRALASLQATDPGTTRWKTILETAIAARLAGGTP